MLANSWNLFSDLDRLDRSFFRTFRDTNSLFIDNQTARTPRTNVYTENDTVILTLEVPGFSESNIQIHAANDTLTIKGERNVQRTDNAKANLQRQPEWSFERSFRFTTKVDFEKATASLKDGVLTVSIPKIVEQKPTRIAIQVAN